jgi:hypothetical protein
MGMKIWHAGFLVAGAALAGGLAMRMAEPPPLPPIPAAPAPARDVAAPANVAAPMPWKPAPPSPPTEVVSSAPPPVYTEPPPPPQPVRRKPFPEPVRVAKAATPSVPAPGPVPYQDPPKPTRHVTLEPGMSIAVRVNEGVLAEAVVADGLEVAERGAKVGIRTEDGNRLRLLSFQSADGQRIEISTEPVAVGETKEVNVIRFSLVKRITITERRM